MKIHILNLQLEKIAFICHWKPGLSGGFEGFHCWKARNRNTFIEL